MCLGLSVDDEPATLGGGVVVVDVVVVDVVDDDNFVVIDLENEPVHDG